MATAAERSTAREVVDAEDAAAFGGLGCVRAVMVYAGAAEGPVAWECRWAADGGDDTPSQFAELV